MTQMKAAVQNNLKIPTILAAVISASLLVISFLAVTPAFAQDKSVQHLHPPTLKELQDVEEGVEFLSVDGGLELRIDAMKEAAISYGARGGLAYQTFQVNMDLHAQAQRLDRTWNFRSLLIPAPSGLLIEPPIVSEAQNALIIERAGQQAAVTDRLYQISAEARIVPTSRTWRQYLEREWGEVSLPPAILLPQNSEERAIWREYVEKGWKMGVEQADEIFELDLDRLPADYTGMVRFRILLAQGLISAPFALLEDRGVSGGGNELRVGDRAIAITGPSKLDPEYRRWSPVAR